MCAEWYFRSGLDRYVWIYGMLLAWVHPHLEAMWEAVEKLSPAQRNLARASIFGTASTVLYVWCAPHPACIVERKAPNPGRLITSGSSLVGYSVLLSALTATLNNTCEDIAAVVRRGLAVSLSTS